MSKDQKNLNIIGYASGNAAEDHSCCMGPIIMEKSEKLKDAKWLGQIYPTDNCQKLEAITSTVTSCEKLAKHTFALSTNKEPFVVIGGDHSCAIGTWSGVSAAKQEKIGMIWIDAHLDAHSELTSHTKNIHGMALSSLLNHGPRELSNLITEGAKISCENLAIIGARDYELEEQKLLNDLGVKIFYMSDIIEEGFASIFSKALAIASANNNGFGISIDIDGFDPEFAPATAITSLPGIIPKELIHEFSSTLQNYHEKLLGLEIAEFFPSLDKESKTENIIADIIAATYL